MSDTIALRGIRVYGRHGADPGEQVVPQPFELDVSVDLDLAAARRTDRLADTLDYAALHRSIVRIVTSTSYALIERIAQEILDAIFVDRRVTRAQVSIAKPKLLAGATPVVTVSQSR